MPSPQWINLIAASRLIGANEALITRNARKGCFGPTRLSATGEVLVSTHGLGLACQTVFTTAQIDAARAGRPIPFTRDDALRDLLDRPRRYSRHQIGAAVAHTIHTEEKIP